MRRPADDDPWLTRTDHDGALEAAGEALHPVLTVVQHPEPRHVGHRLLLRDGEAVVLGRGGPALGPGGLDDRWISRRHCRVVRDGERYRIADLGSHNGTWRNGAQVEQADLDDGDVLGVGGVLLVAGRAPLILEPAGTGELVGISAVMARLHARIRAVADQPVTVMVAGETGTGKELVARALHAGSGRRGQLVAVNCGAVHDGVVHSELFGHVRGAFSHAERSRGGLVESAAGGTLFLDEIGDASPTLQASLLRLIENREYRPVGSDAVRQTDARFVVATHVDLGEAVRAGRFREDLHARLHRWVISVPPLRERREDILPLARHFGERAVGRPIRMSRRLAVALLRHSWPANVRELQAVVEQAAIEAADAELDLTNALAERLRLPELESPTPPPSKPRGRAERPAPDELRALVVAHGGKVAAVADALGVGRNTLYRWLTDAGVDLAEARAAATSHRAP